MYTYYTHLNTLYIKKIPAKFNPCMHTYTLPTAWFDCKMFSSAKEKEKELNITVARHASRILPIVLSRHASCIVARH